MKKNFCLIIFLFLLGCEDKNAEGDFRETSDSKNATDGIHATATASTTICSLPVTPSANTIPTVGITFCRSPDFKPSGLQFICDCPEPGKTENCDTFYDGKVLTPI